MHIVQDNCMHFSTTKEAKREKNEEKVDVGKKNGSKAAGGFCKCDN